MAKVDLDGRRATGVTTVDLDGTRRPPPRRLRGARGVGHRVQPPRPALGLPGPERARRPRPDVPLVHRRLRLLPHRAGARATAAGPRATASRTSPTPTSPAPGPSPRLNGLPYLRGGILELGGSPAAHRRGAALQVAAPGPVAAAAVRLGLQAAHAGEPVPRPAGRHPDGRRGPAPAHQHRRPRSGGAGRARRARPPRHLPPAPARGRGPALLHPAPHRAHQGRRRRRGRRPPRHRRPTSCPHSSATRCPTTSTSWAACAWAPTPAPA